MLTKSKGKVIFTALKLDGNNVVTDFLEYNPKHFKTLQIIETDSDFSK